MEYGIGERLQLVYDYRSGFKLFNERKKINEFQLVAAKFITDGRGKLFHITHVDELGKDIRVCEAYWTIARQIQAERIRKSLY